jgi:hypothetical protein
LFPLLALLGISCHSAPTAIPDGRAYPTNVTRAPSLNIQVFRQTTRIELTNTTAKPFGKSTVWLNGRFYHDIPGLAVGEHIVLKLTDFKDRFGDPFRAGGFFAVETPDIIGLAEIETPAEDGSTLMLGLVVVGQEDFHSPTAD